MEIDELAKPNPFEKKKRFVERSKSKSKFHDVPLENEPSRMKSVTEALLHKIKKENYSKFNKSSMLIKFGSRKDKETILTKEARLYGLNYKGFKNIKFEEGFCKSTISLTGFPWGCGSKELERHLNKILEPERIPIRVEENCILTKNSIAIQFDYLSEAFLAIQKLNETSFQVILSRCRTNRSRLTSPTAPSRSSTTSITSPPRPPTRSSRKRFKNRPPTTRSSTRPSGPNPNDHLFNPLLTILPPLPT